MKRLLLVMMVLASGCGYSAVDNELMGQVKKVTKQTPLICVPFKAADISLGVMRNGVGSMSTQDVWVYVQSERDYETLAKAAETGDLVKVRYNEYRVTFCIPDHEVTSVEVVK